MKNLTKIGVLFMGMFLLIGCAATSVEEGNEESEQVQNITIYGGSVGGVWSIFTEGVTEAVRKEYPGTMISAIPGTVAGNPILVSDRKTDFALSESLTAFFAYAGKQPFNEKKENIRAVAAIIPENVFQFVAPNDAPFHTVSDIVQNNVRLRYSPGEKDALGDLVSSAVFQAYGMSYKDMEANGGEVQYLSGTKTFELMNDARMDGLGKMVPIPAGDILEASATIDLKLIPIGQKAIDFLVETYGMTPFTIPEGSYDFQKKDYHTVNAPTILITHADVSEKVVYQVTKSIYEQLDYLRNVHHGFKAVNDQTMIEVGSVPLHPGAEQFYKEQGLK